MTQKCAVFLKKYEKFSFVYNFRLYIMHIANFIFLNNQSSTPNNFKWEWQWDENTFGYEIFENTFGNCARWHACWVLLLILKISHETSFTFSYKTMIRMRIPNIHELTSIWEVILVKKFWRKVSASCKLYNCSYCTYCNVEYSLSIKKVLAS